VRTLFPSFTIHHALELTFLVSLSHLSAHWINPDNSKCKNISQDTFSHFFQLVPISVTARLAFDSVRLTLSSSATYSGYPAIVSRSCDLFCWMTNDELLDPVQRLLIETV